MPQLDVATYFSQFFWLSFFFILLLFVSTRFMLPRVASIHHSRREKIEGTREQAAELQQQAHEVQQTFEQHLLQVRHQAQDKILQASKEIFLHQEKEKRDIDQRLKSQLQSSEIKILEQKNDLTNQVQSIAQSLTTDIIYKVLEKELLPDSIEQAVHQVIKKQVVGRYDS